MAPSEKITVELDPSIVARARELIGDDEAQLDDATLVGRALKAFGFARARKNRRQTRDERRPGKDAPAIPAQRDGSEHPNGVGVLMDCLPGNVREFILERSTYDSGRKMAEAYKLRGQAKGNSRTRISDRYIDASKALVHELNGRSLESLEIAAIIVDGAMMGRTNEDGTEKTKTLHMRTEIWALGITMDGYKVPLGVVDGPSESADLTEKLITNLTKEGRDLDISNCLWIIDGSKALRAGIRRVAGKDAAIQRCRVHKGRNVGWQNLGAKVRPLIAKKVYEGLREAWEEPNRDEAVKRLAKIYKYLKSWKQVKAAQSVFEGLEETLTLKDLWKDLDLDDPEVRKQLALAEKILGSSNAQEAVHDEWRRWEENNKQWETYKTASKGEWTDIRLRVAATAIACAELAWKPTGLKRETLEKVTLGVVKRRYAEVVKQTFMGVDLFKRRNPKSITLTVDCDETTVTVSRLRCELRKQRYAYDAVRDLAHWADCNGKTLHIEPRALEYDLDGGPKALEYTESGARLRRWLIDRGGFTEVDPVQPGTSWGSFVREPRPRGERAAEGMETDLGDADALTIELSSLNPSASVMSAEIIDQAQNPHKWLPDEKDENLDLRIAIGERALALGPKYIGLAPEQLETVVGQYEAAYAALASTPDEVTAWDQRMFKDVNNKDIPNWERAAWEVALERERARRSPKHEYQELLTHPRCRTLGKARTELIMAEVKRIEGYIEEMSNDEIRPYAENVRGAFDGLDTQVKRINHAAHVCAAARETQRRQQLEAIKDRVREGGGPALGTPQVKQHRDDAVSLPERYVHSIGASHQRQLLAYAEALARELRLKEVDDATLLELRRELDGPWGKLLDSASGLTTVRMEKKRRVLLKKNDPFALMYKAGKLAHMEETDRKQGRWGRGERYGEGAAVRKRQAHEILAKANALSPDPAELRKDPRCLARFMLEHPVKAALDAAAEMELRRRELERAQEAPASQIETPAVEAELAGAGVDY